VLLYFIVVVCKPVVLYRLNKNWVFACLGKTILLFFLELANKLGFEAREVVKTFDYCIVLVFEVSERRATLNICLLVL